jgi:ribose transport system substrate-binding protein
MTLFRPRTLLHTFLVLLFATLFVTACGSTATTSQPAGPAPGLASVPAGYVDTSAYKKNSPYTVCFSNASVSNTWRVAMVEHLRYEIKQHPEIGTFRATDANDDPAKQLQDTEELLSQGCDVLILSPAQQTLTAAVDKAAQHGVPVVMLDRTVTSDSYVALVEASSCEMGRAQAEWLVKALNGSGNIVLLSGVQGATPAEERLRCAREVFAKAPGIKELAQAYVNWSPAEAKQVTAKWLEQFPRIDGIWSDGLQGAGAVEAFVQKGKPVPPVTGEDFNGFLKLWKEHNLNAVAVSFPVRMGRVAVTTALDILAGKPVPHHLDVPNTIITNDNLVQYIRPNLPDDYWADSDADVVKLMFPTQ